MLFTVRILKCEEKEEKDSLNCSTSIFQKAPSRSFWSGLLSELKWLHEQNASNNQDKFNKDCDITRTILSAIQVKFTDHHPLYC